MVALRRAVIGLAVLWGISSLSWPFGTDQGFWAWVGEAILKGGAPYRDAFDSKGPVAYYLGALPQLLFGRNEWGMRLVELGWLAAGVALLVRTGRLRDRRVAAFAAATTFFLLYAGSGFWSTAQPDGWAGVLLIGAAALAMRGLDGRLAPLVLSGVLVGLCVMIKPTYAGFLAVPLCGALLAKDATFARRTLGAAVSLGGVALAIGAVLGLLAGRGALGDYFEVQRWTATVYAGLGGLPFWRLRATVDTLLTLPFVVLLPLAVLGGLTVWGRDRPRTVIVLAWLGAGLLNLLVQGKFWAYQATPLFGPIAWLSGHGAEQLLGGLTLDGVPRSARPRAMSTLAVAVLGVAAFALALPVLDQVARWGAATVGLISEQRYLDVVAASPEHPATAVRTLAGYLADSTRADEYVYVWGAEPAVYYLANRRAPTRFASSRVLVEGEGSPLRERYRAELARDLARHPPRYLIVAAPGRCPAAAQPPDFRCADALPALQQVLQHYHQETTIGWYAVFRLNAAGPP